MSNLHRCLFLLTAVGIMSAPALADTNSGFSTTLSDMLFAATPTNGTETQIGDWNTTALNVTGGITTTSTVGIGTNAPQATLDVVGTIRATGAGETLGAVCTGNSIAIDLINNIPIYCDSTSWVAIGGFVPAHAVEAFNLTACPSGWSVASYLAGRIVLGAGNSGTTGAIDHPIWSQGGNEKMIVAMANLPTNIFVPQSYNGWGGSNSGAQWVWQGNPWGMGGDNGQGGGQPLSVLPPYTTLIYCEKL